ncbi:MAG TPA: GGDEF domain-containing protein, partial [Actinoplanes sp.]
MTTRAVHACFSAWIVALTVVYYAVPATNLYTWALIGYSSAAAMLVGTRRHQPARRLPWYLMSAALASFTTGDTVYNVIVALGREPTFPGVADLFYLLVYPLLTGGFLLLMRARTGGGSDRAALLDALVPTMGLGLLSWVYWIAPFTRLHDLSLLGKLVSIGYPLGDVLALSMLLRMLTVPGKRPRALKMISLAMLGLLVSDIFYGQSQLNSAWSLGGPIDFGWVIFYANMGRTALHASMRDLSEPATEHASDHNPHRIIWMASAALIAPVVLYLEWITGQGAGQAWDGLVNAPIIACAAALTFLVVIARVNGLTTDQRQARTRELALRRAGASLFAAADERGAVRAVREAVATLMPAGERYRLILGERAA